MKLKISVILALSILLGAVSCGGSSNASKEFDKEIEAASVATNSIVKDPFIEKFVENLHRKYHFNGNVLIAKKGKILYEGSFGWANYLLKDSLSVDSKFQLASITKTFTGIATLQLVEKGKIKLDDTIQKFFPDFPSKGISIRMLLSHRSGLTNYVYFTDKYWKDKKKPMTNLDAIQLFVKYKPAPYAKPDTRFHYNNTNYMLLAAIIEKVSKQTLNNYLKKNIFEEAGMNASSQFSLSDENKGKFEVIGHDRGSFKYSVVPNFLDGVVGDKGIYSTVRDLYKYHIALSNNRLLGKKWLDSAYMGRSKPMHGRFNYGYGWRTFDGNAHKVVYHTGWWHGFKNISVRDLKNNITLIFLGNLSNGSLQNLDELYKYLKMPVIRQGAYDAKGNFHDNLNLSEEE